MKTMTHERNRHTIKDVSTGDRKPYKSINAAKKESRNIQMKADRALGRGSVKVTH